jgi:AbiV family abortive infection protein
VALAAFAREELGRSQTLLKFWRSKLGGETVTIEQIDAACTDHVEKQRAGMLSTVMTADRDSELGRLLNVRLNNSPQSEERKDADAELKKIDKVKAKRTPSDRHEKRMASLYVEPKSSDDWNRPGDLSAETAFNFLQDAINDYAGRHNQSYLPAGEAILAGGRFSPTL